VMGAWMAHW